jgi:NarL family two-component system sensor histidine kinase LiaS
MLSKMAFNKIHKSNRSYQFTWMNSLLGWGHPGTKSSPGQLRIIYLYRYISLLITSFSYIIGEPKSPFFYKAGVVVSLCIAAKVITGLYIKYHENHGIIKRIILAETFGITLLLIPTGGLNSSYIWYALNPVLVAACFLRPAFYWANLVFYMFAATFITYVFYDQFVEISTLVQDYYQSLLVFILITLAVRLLSGFMQKLDKQAQELALQKEQLMKANNSLEKANETINEELEHIMSLYQTVEAFTSQDNLEGFMRVFADCASRLTKNRLSFFWIAPFDNKSSSIAVSSVAQPDMAQELSELINSKWVKLKKLKKAAKICTAKGDFCIVPVSSYASNYGIMGLELKDTDPEEFIRKYERQLTFLSDMSAVIMERFRLEEVSNHLIVAQEQNRIANEIHDNVSHRLFGIVCAAHMVASNWETNSRDEVEKQLLLIRDSANTAMKELRSSIYRLSPKKRGENVLEASLKSYLKNISKLNSIDIDFSMNGSGENLSHYLKKTIYRIVCEATGNAVRHGRCSKIDIDLCIQSGFVKLFVRDNGKGFDIGNKKQSGLGINNMETLVEAFCGKFELKSQEGYGTEIQVIIPVEPRVKEAR